MWKLQKYGEITGNYGEITDVFSCNVLFEAAPLPGPEGRQTAASSPARPG